MLIDLTIKLSQDNPIFKTFPESKALLKLGHVGTHLDRMKARDIPLDYFRSRGLVFDVSKIRNRDIEISDLPEFSVKKGDFVLFYTGYIQEYAYGTKEYFRNHPELSWELIEHLRKNQVHFIGLDAPGVRRGQEHYQADKSCAESGVFIIENLIHLDQLFDLSGSHHPITVYCLWWEMDKMTGIPCRVVAETC